MATYGNSMQLRYSTYVLAPSRFDYTDLESEKQGLQIGISRGLQSAWSSAEDQRDSWPRGITTGGFDAWQVMAVTKGSKMIQRYTIRSLHFLLDFQWVLQFFSRFSNFCIFTVKDPGLDMVGLELQLCSEAVYRGHHRSPRRCPATEEVTPGAQLFGFDEQVPWFPLWNPWCPDVPNLCTSIFQHFDVGFDTAIPPSRRLEVEPLGSTITDLYYLYYLYIIYLYYSVYLYYLY